MKKNEVIQLFNIIDDTNIGFKNPQRGRIYSPHGISPCLNCCERGMGEPKITETKTESFMAQLRESESKPFVLPEELKGNKFRIRKLTERECFRLMGVDDADIDKIQASGISKTAQYKLAGNSIVVDVLYHLFRKMFIDKEPDKSDKPQQLSLF